MDAQETALLHERGDLEFALQGIVTLANRLALRVIVLEATSAELISALPPLDGQQFSRNFKARIANLMQQHANRLLPVDDAALALAADNILKCVNRG